MHIEILCPSAEHPVNAWLGPWASGRATILRSTKELTGGDFLFLISCGEIVTPEQRAGYRHTLVIHASDLPRGRGWSPHVWDVVQGATKVTVSMIAAADPVDSGDIWKQEVFDLDGTELHDEINAKLFDAEIRLMDWAVENCDLATPSSQCGPTTRWPRRTPEHSKVNADQTIAEVFDLLRVCDPERFPAFLEHRGARYVIDIRRAD